LKLSPEIARIVFWICVASCVIAQLGILRSTLRASKAGTAGDRNGGETPVPTRVNRPAELSWAILPAVALILVFAGTWKVMQRVSDAGDVPAGPQQTAPSLSGAASSLALQAPAAPSTRSEKPALRAAQNKIITPQERDAVVVPVPTETQAVGLQEYQPQQMQQQQQQDYRQ
jgi:hypothetical protein